MSSDISLPLLFVSLVLGAAGILTLCNIFAYLIREKLHGVKEPNPQLSHGFWRKHNPNNDLNYPGSPPA